MAVLVTRFRYRDTFLKRFIDNEAARYPFIKGASPSLSMFLLIREVDRCITTTGAWCELASSSNIADLHLVENILKACELVRGVPKAILHSVMICSWDFRQNPLMNFLLDDRLVPCVLAKFIFTYLLA